MNKHPHTSQTSRPVVASTTTAHPLPPTLHGDAAVAHFQPALRALPPAALETFTGDAQLWSHNARLGIHAIAARLGEIQAKLPQVPLADVLQLPNVVRALEFTVGRLSPRSAVSREQIDAQYAKLQALRGPVLLMAQVFAAPAVGLLAAELVTGLVAGSGMYNHAQDGIGLAAAFREHRAQLTGKHPFSDAQLAELEQLGIWLSEHITPDGGRAVAADRTLATQRDGLAALARARHADLRLIGIALWGELGVDAHIPKLGSRSVASPKAAPDAPPSAPPPSEPPATPNASS
jgi:hypothetical protein